MDKDELASLFVRAFGVYFVLNLASDLLVILWTLMSLAKIHLISPVEISDARGYVVNVQWTRIQSVSVGAMINAVFGYYCLYRGAMLHRLLTSGMPISKGN